MRQQVVLTALAILVAGAMSGCGAFKSLVGGNKYTRQDARNAFKRNDMETLARICAAGKPTTRRTRDLACLLKNKANGDQAYLAAVQKQDFDHLYAVCDGKRPAGHKYDKRAHCRAMKPIARKRYDAESGSCSTVVAAYEKWKRPLGGSYQDLKSMFFHAGNKIARCGNWDYLWRKMMHVGKLDNGTAHQLLVQLDRAGLPVAAKLWSYLQSNGSNSFSGREGMHSLNHSMHFLVTSGKVGNCARFLPFVNRQPGDLLGQWVEFFAKTNCKAGADVVARQLQSRRKKHRIRACNVLSRIGGRRQLRAVRGIAMSDPVFFWRHSVRVYPVRDACRSAASIMQSKR